MRGDQGVLLSDNDLRFDQRYPSGRRLGDRAAKGEGGCTFAYFLSHEPALHDRPAGTGDISGRLLRHSGSRGSALRRCKFIVMDLDVVGACRLSPERETIGVRFDGVDRVVLPADVDPTGPG